MPLTHADLPVVQGADFSALVTVLHTLTRLPADLTGFTAKSQIRRGVADHAPEVVWEILATVQTPNFVHLFIPHEATANFCGRYDWDLDIVSAENIITTIMAGKVIVRPEVTR